MSKPENFPWLSPYIIVDDVKAARKFYEDVFQFTRREGEVKNDDGELSHAELAYKDAVVMIGKMGTECEHSGLPPKQTHSRSPISLYLYCEDVDVFYQRAIDKGAKSILAPEDTFWGDRMCSLEDLDGYHWSFATNLKQQYAQ